MLSPKEIAKVVKNQDYKICNNYDNPIDKERIYASISIRNCRYDIEDINRNLLELENKYLKDKLHLENRIKYYKESITNQNRKYNKANKEYYNIINNK